VVDMSHYAVQNMLGSMPLDTLQKIVDRSQDAVENMVLVIPQDAVQNMVEVMPQDAFCSVLLRYMIANCLMPYVQSGRSSVL
jgi:hypothetical protein